MNKSDKLEILEILSALESWSFSTGKPLPDYLMDRMGVMIGMLRDEILEGK